MRLFLVYTLVFTSLNSVVAQQRPQFTQYFFNNFLVNPAISGIERYTDVRLGYRNQWVGIQGAPVTSFFYGYAPIGKNYIFGNAGSFSESGNNPNSRSYLRNYMAADPHHGIGFHVVTDQSGPFNATDFNLTYAYHMGLSPQLNLSLGLSVGLSSDKLDISKIDLEHQNDPIVVNSLGTKISPDAGFGLWFYGPAFFAGLSFQQLLSQLSQVTFGGKQVTHTYLTGAYKVFLSEDISAQPSVMFKYTSASPISVDLSFKTMFKDVFWTGLGFRNGDSLSAFAGFHLASLVNVSYAYDVPISHFRTVTSGTHEFMLGLLLNNRYKVTCAQMLW